jgi:signal transduction histidine kinase
MVTSDLPQVLVVAGDYDIVVHVQQALQNERLSLQRAYTHRDALYTLEHTQFDLALVDAAMVDRHSQEHTLKAIARLNRQISLIAVDLQGVIDDQSGLFTDAVIKKLDKQQILHSVQETLRLTSAADGRATQEVTTMAGDMVARRIDEIQTLFALSRSLTEVLDLTEVLNRVVEAARRLTNADEGMILLPDEDALYLRAKVGIDVEVARNFRIRTQDTLAGQVFGSGQPLLVGDQGPQKVKTEYFVNSLLYVPILLQGNPIGVLGVNNKNKADVFDLNQQELLVNLASYAAIAIENARIHEESLQRARDLETLVEISQILNSSLSLEDTLLNICKELVQVLGVNRAEVYELHTDTRRLVAQARYYRAVWRFGQGPSVPLSRYPALQKALKQNHPLWMSRDNHTGQGELEVLDKAGAAALMLIPIYSQDRVLGAIRAFYVQSPQTTPNPDSVQSAIHTALEGLAMILSNTDQTRAINVSRLLENINRSMSADWCDLSSLVNDGELLSIHAEVGQGVWPGMVRPVIDLSKYSDLVENIQAHNLINPQQNSGAPKGGTKALMDVTASRAVLGLPFTQHRHADGLVLVAHTERVRNFTKREIDMCRTIIGQAGTALENANLVRDLELSLQELKDTQDRLVQTARLSAMGELAAVVAHQINNPLTTIVVDSELLMMNEPPNSKNYDTMQAISRAGKRAASVAKRLLSISRPNDPESPAEPIDVVDTIRGVLSLVQTHIERDRIRVAANLPDEPIPRVQAVRGQLDDVWLNLIMNAHDALFGQKDAQINIDLQYNIPKKLIEVTVADNGPGIPDKIMDQIFNPFFTTKPPGEGTGIGLHICRQVVERVGGKIWVESHPGQGAQFFIYIPVDEIKT